jgi:hypothetical protein
MARLLVAMVISVGSNVRLFPVSLARVMRRFTLITLIVLFVALGVAAFLQYRAGQEGERHLCGPGVPDCVPGSVSPTP